jgi:acetyl esterase
MPEKPGGVRITADTYIETAEYDCLHDEGILYGERLRAAGANVEINETKGTIHGYDSALKTKVAVDNIKKRILFLRRGFW